jgi:hypothetical protein
MASAPNSGVVTLHRGARVPGPDVSRGLLRLVLGACCSPAHFVAAAPSFLPEWGDSLSTPPAKPSLVGRFPLAPVLRLAMCQPFRGDALSTLLSPVFDFGFQGEIPSLPFLWCGHTPAL